MLLQLWTFSAPSWSFITVTPVKAVFYRALGKPKCWGWFATSCSCAVTTVTGARGCVSWGLWSKSFSPPTSI